MDSKALYKISYGLFIVSSREGDADAACIGNVLAQVASSPTRVALSLNKLNRTCWVVKRSGVFNASILTEDAPFSVYKHFGLQSGAHVDKFAGRDDPRSENGVVYFPEYSNALLSAKVVSEVDLGSHFLFIGELTESRVLSDAESATYDYYQKNVKPKPAPKTNAKGWRCRVCGYLHESEELPADFVCPVCKHGAVDFERVE